VALRALQLLVQASELIARLSVIDVVRRIFPVDEVVTLQSFLSQPSFVEILVTRNARLRDTQEGLAEIFLLNVRALGRWYAFGKVTLVARQPRVLAFQKIAGFLVIEFIRVPFDQREVGAVVAGLT